MKKMMDWISNTWSNRGCLGKVIVLMLALLLLACPCGLLSSLLPSTPTPTPRPSTPTPQRHSVCHPGTCQCRDWRQ